MSKRKQTQTNADKRNQTQRQKRKQTRANVDKRKQTLTPSFIAVFYTPLFNPLNFALKSPPPLEIHRQFPLKSMFPFWTHQNRLPRLPSFDTQGRLPDGVSSWRMVTDIDLEETGLEGSERDKAVAIVHKNIIYIKIFG